MTEEVVKFIICIVTVSCVGLALLACIGWCIYLDYQEWKKGHKNDG